MVVDEEWVVDVMVGLVRGCGVEGEDSSVSESSSQEMGSSGVRATPGRGEVG